VSKLYRVYNQYILQLVHFSSWFSGFAGKPLPTHILYQTYSPTKLQMPAYGPGFVPSEGEKMRRCFLPILVLLAAILACSVPGKPTAVPTNVPTTVMLAVYFTDMARYQVGTEPYEAEVTRRIPPPASLPEAVLTQLFLGPSKSEKAQGLAVVLSGTTGFSKLVLENGIARVYLTGMCNSKGATYTIANLIFANLKQFPEIQWIKIYDQNGETETPDGQSSSIPICLEP
jgi:Sporulation and spore germination